MLQNNETKKQKDIKDEELISSRISTKKKNKRKEAIGWILSLGAAVILALLLRFFVFEFVRVDGPSMKKTLLSDEIVFVEKVSYKFAKPKRSEVVFFYAPDNEILVKRIIGLPGDKIEIRNFKLYINDSEAAENYIYEPMDTDMAPLTVPDNCVYVMGDNRNLSIDSRSDAIGPVPFDKILGRGVFIVWPFDKMSAIAHG